MQDIPTNPAPMLAGLIFAIEDATDRPGALAATLPFGGMTLLEYQVRLLAGAGVEQIFVAVGRMTPALLAAVSRASERETRVEIVRSAEEAAEKVGPDAAVLVLADGLVTTDTVIERMTSGGAEALLVTSDPESPAAIERLDMKDCWAGIARVSGRQLGDIANMPADYDFQSALLRVSVQSGAEHVALTASQERAGHLVELSADALSARSNGVLAALTERRTNWADRWVFTPIARLALPELVRRNLPGWSLRVGAGLFAVIGLGLALYRLPGAGLAVSLLSVAFLATGAAMAALRGEMKRADTLELAITGLFAAMVAATGWASWEAIADWTPVVLSIAAIGLQILVERIPARPRRWWASPAAHLLILTPLALAGYAEAGLAAAALYAFATLAAAVEALREKP